VEKLKYVELTEYMNGKMKKLNPLEYDTEEESPIVRLPPKKTYSVKLHIRKIEKGKPSICNEIEEEIYL
jgi:hypothetical protein